MLKKLMKFQFDIILHNKQLIFRVCLILSISIILMLLVTCSLGNTKNQGATSEEWYQYEVSLMPEKIQEQTQRIEETNYDNYGWYDEASAKYYDKKVLAEYELYNETHTYYLDYYDLHSSIEPASSHKFNPAARLMIWTFLSSIAIMAFAIFFPMAYSNSKDRYKNLLVLGCSSKELAISEITMQYILLGGVWFLLMIIGSICGINSHGLQVVQYNNGEAIAVSIYIVFLIKQALVLIIAMFLMSCSISLNAVLRNKLISSALLLLLIIVPFSIALSVGSFGLSMYDGEVAVFPVINLVMDEWIVGNYKLIWISAIYLVAAVSLCIWKIKYEESLFKR